MTDASGDSEGKRFFRSLYDFGFTSLIAPRFIRFLYGLLVVLYTLGTIAGIVGEAQDGSSAALIGIVVIVVAYFISLIFLRIVMEALIVFFRMGADVRAIRGGQPLGGGAVAGLVTEPVSWAPGDDGAAYAPAQPAQVQQAQLQQPQAAVAAAAVAQQPVAGWYDAPGDPANYRYWDGAAWTEHVRPRTGP